jgi:acetyl-CoA decarbonylase/synthase complex subunit gamma
MVNGEIENARVPIWLLIMDTEGLSVLTAWAAGKFVGDSIADFIKKSGIAEKIKHRRLIIPGYVASLQTELQEWLPEWNIIVGPRESTNLPKFLKN